MRWSDEPDESPAPFRFREVGRSKAADLSWAAGGTAGVMSLRPPRLPSFGAEVSLEPEPMPQPYSEEEEVSGLHPIDASRAPDGPGLERASEPVAVLAASERPRVDTLVDEIAPRAEEEALTALRGALARHEADQAGRLRAVEEQAVALALVVARRVLAREVSLDPTVVRALVREGLEALAESDRVIVRVGSFFGEARELLEADLRRARVRAEVLVDPGLGETGCLVETELGSVDESIETRLSNLLDVLAEASHAGGGA